MPSKAELLQYLQDELEKNRLKSKGWGDRLLSPEVRGQQNSISQPGPSVEDPSVGEKLAMGGMALSNLPATGAAILLQKLQDHLFPSEPSITDSLIPDPLTGELKPTQKTESFLPYVGKNNPKIRAQYKKVFGFDPLDEIVVRRSQKEPGSRFASQSGRGAIFMEGASPSRPQSNVPNLVTTRSNYHDSTSTVGGPESLIGVFSPKNPLLVFGSGSPGKPGLKSLLGDPTENINFEGSGTGPWGKLEGLVTSTTGNKDYRAHNPKLEGRLKSHWFDKEKVLAEQAKRGGYDSAITVEPGKPKSISEIMDFQAPTQHRLTEPTSDGSLFTKNKLQLGVPGVSQDRVKKAIETTFTQPLEQRMLETEIPPKLVDKLKKISPNSVIESDPVMDRHWVERLKKVFPTRDFVEKKSVEKTLQDIAIKKYKLVDKNWDKAAEYLEKKLPPNANITANAPGYTRNIHRKSYFELPDPNPPTPENILELIKALIKKNSSTE